MSDMVNVIGVRYKRAGRVYYFDKAGLEAKANEFVVVPTPRGQKVAQVVSPSEQVQASQLTEPLKLVIRKATEEDLRKSAELSGREAGVLAEVSKMVAKHNLPMKPLSAEFNLEGNHLTVYFKAAERVDFRELVKELNGHFRMRVDLRQVGPRDEAKIIGGCGRCGLTLCCASFLSEFAPVSIKMAKQQNIPLNPTKIVGSCGRLLCCLAYEAEPGPKREKKTVAPASAEENSDASEELLAEEVIPEPGAVISEIQPTENSIE